MRQQKEWSVTILIGAQLRPKLLAVPPIEQKVTVAIVDDSAGVGWY